MSNHPPRILVAEDNSVLSSVIRFNIERAGYTVTVAANGREAMEHLSVGGFDFLITDYQMPEAMGSDVCDHVRRTLNNQDLPIILCSAKGMELDTTELQERWKLAAVFYKPFSMRAMLACIREQLDRAAENEPSCAAGGT